MENANYETQMLNGSLCKIFTGVYNDFCSVAKSDYMFELDPLDYQGFIDAIEKNLIKCIVLLENHIPTAFLVYTTAISESIELNIIHCLGNEDLLTKRKILVEKLLHWVLYLVTDSRGTYIFTFAEIPALFPPVGGSIALQ